ncbi:pirin family protein [Pseudoalteromonas luteoviolacea]|uniref:Pirin N-terminal domain-containing protein n=1 Tax=Pseudoalteromonas luteoviolacea S4060-1 TaxID=1365257 RepID=A0A167JK38_9GAMM|nr:pirin family protein [Pseudoalteromonas luteoviolacea]KZN61231.1 hypothetical protein N478_04000 [Pseudoalteromonas luteoviolacea S4060-1]
MNTDAVRIIDKQTLPIGGFSGIVETRMAMSPKAWPHALTNTQISHGLDDFIYLAYGHFKPNNGAPLHPHRDVDIVSFITSGSVGHQGTLGDGTIINGPGVQVQRAGTGMQHAEFSVNDEKAGIVQIWFLPPKNGLSPAYQNFTLDKTGLTTVLGGSDSDTFDSDMHCQIGFIEDDETLALSKPFVAIITRGTATINGKKVTEGQLIEGKNMSLTATENLGLVLITQGEGK